MEYHDQSVSVARHQSSGVLARFGARLRPHILSRRGCRDNVVDLIVCKQHGPEGAIRNLLLHICIIEAVVLIGCPCVRVLFKPD